MRYFRLLINLAFCASLAACAAPSFSIANPAGLEPAAMPETGASPAAPASTPVPESLAPEPTATATVAPSLTPMASHTATPVPTVTSRPSPTLPNQKPAVPTPCAETNGIVASLSITPTTLHYALDARVYLPPCYAGSDQRYPVLYLLHGLSSTENQWIELGVVTATETLLAAGEIAPLIIVMPRDRLDDRFDPAFVEDLVPYIDQHYRTQANRQHRAIGGLSRGAGWALHLGLHYPDQFGRIGAHSPAVFYGDENNLRNWTWHLPPGQVPAIYIDIGDNDGQINSASWLDQIFTWFKVKHTYIVQPGAHIASYWSAHIPDYLRFYAAGWRDLPAPTPTLDGIAPP